LLAGAVGRAPAAWLPHRTVRPEIRPLARVQGRLSPQSFGYPAALQRIRRVGQSGRSFSTGTHCEFPMPLKTVFSTEIQHLSILNEHGKFDAKLGKDLIPDEDLVKLYEHMSICRHLDEIAFKLQRSGRMGTYPQNKGQEAAALGSGYAANERRRLPRPCYRENAALFYARPPRCTTSSSTGWATSAATRSPKA
jgi:hypothetical protein